MGTPAYRRPCPCLDLRRRVPLSSRDDPSALPSRDGEELFPRAVAAPYGSGARGLRSSVVLVAVTRRDLLDPLPGESLRDPTFQ